MPTSPFNFKFKTLGGKQFWTDVQNSGGWRVQENTLNGHFRLIDEKNVRHAWGTFDDCQVKLLSLIESGAVAKTKGRVVIIAHGLIRSTRSMKRLGDYLERHGKFTAVYFQYASTRRPVSEHAKALQQVIDSLGPKVTEINFVAHSLGNIVFRRMLGDQLREGREGDPRYKRMVMIGPPNQGSRIARVLRYSLLYNIIAGSSGSQLGCQWEQLEPTLAIPWFEFGIIAGGQDHRWKPSNFLLPGKDDFTVCVEETRLPGAQDFLVKPLLHGTMMRQKGVLESTLRFLEHGYFVSADTRHPITSLDKLP